MIIPSFKAKGGIASLVDGYRGSELENAFQIHYIETYCDGGKIAKFCKAVTAYAAFLRELLFSRPDLVHIHSAFSASFFRKVPFVYLSVLLGIPVINHIHGSELEQFYLNASSLKKQFIRATYNRCTKIIVLSEQWKEQFSCLVPADRLAVVVNYSSLQSPAPDASVRSARPQILYLGFLSERKGCFDIPEIAATVCREIDDAEFVLGGAGKDEGVQQILSLAEKYNVSERLLFPGWVKDEQKDSLLRSAALYFLPSYSEGMPMSILEAMGYGLPVVSTTVGGIPAIVREGENGYLCSPGNCSALAHAIVRILKNPDLRNAMSQRSLEIIRDHYTKDCHIGKLIELYNTLLS